MCKIRTNVLKCNGRTYLKGVATMNGGNERRYRPGLPEMPRQIRQLPVERGYPVPWFVARVDGHYDFRVADGRKMPLAVKKRLCYICGQPLGKEYTFPIGP